MSDLFEELLGHKLSQKDVENLFKRYNESQFKGLNSREIRRLISGDRLFADHEDISFE